MKNKSFIRKRAIKKYVILSYIYYGILILDIISMFAIFVAIFFDAPQKIINISCLSVCISAVILLLISLARLKENKKIIMYIIGLKSIRRSHYIHLFEKLVKEEKFDEVIPFYLKNFHQKDTKHLFLLGYLAGKTENTKYYDILFNKINSNEKWSYKHWGTLIVKKSITAITKIEEDTSQAFLKIFFPEGLFTFQLQYGDMTMSFKTRYKLKFYSNRPISEVSRQLAFVEINNKRNEILKKLKIK